MHSSVGYKILLNLVVNELETIFCFKKSMFTNNKIQHTGILNQLNFQPNKMLSTIFVDVHPKLHMFIKLWSNIIDYITHEVFPITTMPLPTVSPQTSSTAQISES